MSDVTGRFQLMEPVSRRVVSESVAHRIVEMITRGELLAGQRLPPERELATSLCVSRPSLREALRGLALLGVVDIRQGSGLRISQLKPEDLLGPLSFFILLDKSNLLALFEARIFIESGLTSLAAERATPEHIEALASLVKRSEETIGMSEEFLEADVQFHQVIAKASGNPLLQRVADSLRVLGRASRAITVNLPPVQRQSHRDHEAILRCIRDRDRDGAGAAMQAHLEHVRSAYLAFGAEKPASGRAAASRGAKWSLSSASPGKPRRRRRGRDNA
jgi:GntR family transcriptional repressor for pyruvate dehydrogenase complex